MFERFRRVGDFVGDFVDFLEEYRCGGYIEEGMVRVRGGRVGRRGLVY